MILSFLLTEYYFIVCIYKSFFLQLSVLAGYFNIELYVHGITVEDNLINYYISPKSETKIECKNGMTQALDVFFLMFIIALFIIFPK